MRLKTLRFLCLLALLSMAAPVWAGLPDTPFSQPRSAKLRVAPELLNAHYYKLCVTDDGIVNVLTDLGVARLFDDILALDTSFRPLAGKRPLDITLSRGELYYLLPDRLVSNADAGRFAAHFPADTYAQAGVKDSGEALLLGKGGGAIVAKGVLSRFPGLSDSAIPLAAGDRFYLAVGPDLFLAETQGVRRFSQPKHGPITTLALANKSLYVGTTDGYFAVDPVGGQETIPLQTRLPATHVTCFVPGDAELWVGTTQGLFRQTPDGAVKYFASRRWLNDDRVLDMGKAPSGDLFVLTPAGLNKIEFRPTTLAEKAAYYDRKIRQRHIRYGFCSELRLRVPGDISTAEMIDTDNDGTWSNYYMASQAFRYGATGEPKARQNAWETFAAMERLESINGLSGFPSRTFERKGFKVSDPDRWHDAPDPDWEWKAHTSSDEITAHAFGCSVLYETCAKTPEEKQRVAAFFLKIIDHIIKNNWYLVDVDGKPTLWGRWNPEYVNWFPHSVGDRRLNSCEIIGMLQFANSISGKPIYRQKAEELFQKHGYLDNIVSSMAKIGNTPGFIHQGENMGNEWNHSDDLLGFVSYWFLVRYAFDETLRAKYVAAVRDHWELEKAEKCPLWNFVLASTGEKEFDAAGALWTLRHFPLDLIDWNVSNTHRRDITKLPPNFRQRELKELLPPDERRVTRWNGHPFGLAGGGNGQTELAGDEFLLPYWMARYLKILD